MKKVTLQKEIFTGIITEIHIPDNVIKEKVYDYQDTKAYNKYYYISKKGNKKECKIKWL